MIPKFDPRGNLPPGIHWATWKEISVRFGTTAWRRQLLAGLLVALQSLKRAGCQTVYLDGSFVTDKPIPKDFDACWDPVGVDPTALDPVLLDIGDGRLTQKARFLGELLPAKIRIGSDDLDFFYFFQTDKDTGCGKGIIALDLGGVV